MSVILYLVRNHKQAMAASETAAKSSSSQICALTTWHILSSLEDKNQNDQGPKALVLSNLKRSCFSTTETCVIPSLTHQPRGQVQDKYPGSSPRSELQKVNPSRISDVNAPSQRQSHCSLLWIPWILQTSFSRIPLWPPSFYFSHKLVCGWFIWKKKGHFISFIKKKCACIWLTQWRYYKVPFEEGCLSSCQVLALSWVTWLRSWENSS